MNIRTYKESDIDELATLFYETVHTINKKDYEKEQLDVWATGSIDKFEWNRSFLSHRALIAEDGDKMIGFADMDETGYLDRLYVHKEYQGIGVATMLCDQLEKEIKVNTYTTHASITAKPFFETRGYHVVKEQRVEKQGIYLTNYVMKKERLSFRYAKVDDCGLILQFIKELADYEQMLHEVIATEDLLKEWIFDKQKAEVLFAMVDGKEIGFALFFHNFSTFLGKSGIYLEDLYIKPEFRGFGYGTSVLQELAAIAVERGCGRLEWWCLDWNQPSIDFYLSLGAEAMKDWTVYRITGETLLTLANHRR